MPLFGKKKGDISSAPASAPTDQVIVMKQQGLSNDQIIQQLQRMGYPPNMIFDAMNQAELSATGAPIAMEPQMPSSMQDMQQMHPEMPPPSMQDMPPPMHSSGFDREQIEETVEAVIDERWEEIVGNINKVIDWKNKTESKINVMETQIKELKENLDKLQAAIIGKINDYDQNILNVGAELKAMEKVFQKILPTFTDNVNELGRITQTLKKPSQPAQKK